MCKFENTFYSCVSHSGFPFFWIILHDNLPYRILHLLRNSMFRQHGHDLFDRLRLSAGTCFKDCTLMCLLTDILLGTDIDDCVMANIVHTSPAATSQIVLIHSPSLAATWNVHALEVHLRALWGSHKYIVLVYLWHADSFKQDKPAWSNWGGVGVNCSAWTEACRFCFLSSVDSSSVWTRRVTFFASVDMHVFALCMKSLHYVHIGYCI